MRGSSQRGGGGCKIDEKKDQSTHAQDRERGKEMHTKHAGRCAQRRLAELWTESEVYGVEETESRHEMK